jgi:N-acetylglucosamine-6-phosphate deacetylase
MGWSERRGRIAPGLDADLVVLTPDLTVLETWVGGRALVPQPVAL